MRFVFAPNRLEQAQARTFLVCCCAHAHSSYDIVIIIIVKSNPIIDSIFERRAQTTKHREAKKYAHEKNLNRFEKSHFNYTIQLQLAQISIMPAHLSLLLLWPVRCFTKFCGHRFILYREPHNTACVCVCVLFFLSFSIC